MAITRAQYLQGNSSQGNVLLGQVQGVKQGTGTVIAGDGTISVDPSTVVGLVKLNNPAAFNTYAWPSTSGSTATFLMSDGSGNLSWQPPSTGSVTVISESAPVSPKVGQLWYDTTHRLLKIYENSDEQESAVWTPVSQGVDPEAAAATSEPAFVGGEGTAESPFAINDLSILSGNFVRSEETITVSGLAPYQYVPITDLSSELNGNRFSASSYFSDGEGNLTFRILFSDFPTSESGITYSADIEVGFGSFRIRSTVGILEPLVLQSAGTISGTPRVGEVLTFNPGTALGGKAPYTYSWVWKKASNGDIIQTNGTTLVVPGSAAGDRIVVQLTATDTNKSVVTGDTAGYPTSPALIGKGAFPQTEIKFPTALFQTISTEWLDINETLYADGCIEISVDGTIWGQGPYSITNGGRVYTRWITSPQCSGASNAAVLTGCIYSNSYEECGAFTIDRVPSPFSFIENQDVQLGAVTASNSITPVGFNASAYVTYAGSSTLKSIQGSLDNGASWVNIPISGTDTFAINPGQSLRIRGTVGSSTETSYTANISIGANSSVQTATFLARTTNLTTFTTQIRFPTSTSQGYGTVPGASSDSWSASDGTVSLYASDCVDFRVQNSSGGVISNYTDAYPRTVAATNVVVTRWKTTGGTSGCGSGIQGRVISGSIHNAATIPLSNRVNTGSMGIDRVPGQFTLQDVAGQALNTQITSATASLTGFNATVYLTVSGTLTGIQASIDSGAWTAVPSSGTSFPIEPVGPSQTPPTLRIRGTTGSATSTGYTAVVQIGDGGDSFTQDTWTVTTTAAIPAIVAPSITSPTNGATGINPFTINPAGVNFTSSAYVPINGASATQLNAVWEIRSGTTTGTVIYSETKTSNFTNWSVPLIVNNAQILLPNTVYYVRVRYTSADAVAVVSNYSAFSAFTTNPVFTQNWALRRSNSTWYYQSDMLANNGTTWMSIALTSYSTSYSYGVVTSTDGTNWSTVGSFAGAAQNAVAYGNNAWLTVGSGTTRRSDNNGVSWATPTNSGLTSQVLWSVAFGNGVFVAVGDNGVIQTTTDSTVWTSRASGTTARISHVIFAQNQFVAVSNGFVLLSANGTTWTRYNMPAIAGWAGNLKIAFLETGTPTYMVVSRGSRTVSPYLSTTGLRSTNLTSWETVTLPNYSIDIVAGSGAFTLLTSTGYAYYPTLRSRVYYEGYVRMYASPTGVAGSWQEQTFPYYYGPNPYNWSRVYWYYNYNYNWPYYYDYSGWYLEYGTTGNGLGRIVAVNAAGEIYSTS